MEIWECPKCKIPNKLAESLEGGGTCLNKSNGNCDENVMNGDNMNLIKELTES